MLLDRLINTVPFSKLKAARLRYSIDNPQMTPAEVRQRIIAFNYFCAKCDKPSDNRESSNYCKKCSSSAPGPKQNANDSDEPTRGKCRYIQNMANGKCPGCGGDRDDSTKRCCTKCRTRAKENYYKKKAKNA